MTTDTAYAEQHQRDSRQMRFLCAARDAAREERDRLADALREIAGYTMSQFSSASDMANACVDTASKAVGKRP